jgi:hypothetical protein
MGILRNSSASWDYHIDSRSAHLVVASWRTDLQPVSQARGHATQLSQLGLPRRI